MLIAGKIDMYPLVRPEKLDLILVLHPIELKLDNNDMNPKRPEYNNKILFFTNMNLYILFVY